MRNKIIKAVCYLLTALIFLAGLSLFAFPLINRAMINSNSQDELEVFKVMRSVQAENKDEQDIDKGMELDKLYADMQKYNEKIFKEGQSGLTDAWSYEQAGFDLSSYGLYNAVVGEIKIPKMNCDLPLYLGATNLNMAKGAAQLGQTSTPIGGENTNCVIAGHRGAAGGEFFKEIQLLEIGDKVYIDNLWENLTYKVTKIEIINPDEISKVLIQKGKDMVTLVTCHPYPYNSQRYVVYCERTENDPMKEETGETQIITETVLQQADVKDSQSHWLISFENATYYLVPMFLVLLIIFLTVTGIIRKRRK